MFFEVTKCYISTKQNEKIWYNLDQIANKQLAPPEWGPETHFEFNFPIPHSVNVS